MTPYLAHHAAVEAIALFIPALAIIGVIAAAVVIDRRRGAEEDAAAQDSPADGPLAEETAAAEPARD